MDKLKIIHILISLLGLVRVKNNLKWTALTLIASNFFSKGILGYNVIY
jgi:hypothetical protein